MSLDSPPSSLDSSLQKNKKTPGSDISRKGPLKKSRTFEGKSSDDDGDCDMTIAVGSEDISTALPIDKEMDEACEELDTSEVTVRLPVTWDHMFEEKQKMLEKRNLSPELQIHTSMHPGVETDVETLIKASRILNLDDIELYFVEDDDDGPFSPRNELLSLNAVFTSINCAVSDSKPDGKKALQEIILKKMDEFSCQYSDNDSIIEYDEDGEELLEWGNSHGMTAKLKISRRPGTGRGAEALENIGVGDIVLEVPNCLIISEDYVRNSTMYAEAGLANMHGINSEELLILWCMKERRNPSSDFERHYFQALPKNFRSGLSFGENARKKLWLSPVGLELKEMTKRLSYQLDKLCSRPDIISKYKFTLEEYWWAHQLLQTNGIKVLICGTLKLCLVPVAGFFNHSLYPHVLPPDSVDSESKSLKFHALRPCNKGEQCYISYGNLSSHDLVKVYGFLPKGPNPYDLIHLDFHEIIEETCSRKLYSGKFIQTCHMMRGNWLSKSRKLPARLLDDLYAILDVTKGDKSEDSVSRVREALDAIHVRLVNIYMRYSSSDEGYESDRDGGQVEFMFDSDGDEVEVDNSPPRDRGQVEFMFDSDGDEVEVDNSPPRQEPEWDVKLANDYKWLMMCTMGDVVSSCEKSLEDWEIKPTCLSSSARCL